MSNIIPIHALRIRAAYKISRNTTPNTNPRLPPYTVPAVRFPNGETILDSLVIAAKLEELFSTPSMHLDAPIIPDIQAAVGRCKCSRIPLFQ